MGIIVEVLFFLFVGAVIVALFKAVLPYLLGLAVIVLGLYLLVQFYWIIIPVAIGLFVLCLIVGLLKMFFPYIIGLVVIALGIFLFIQFPLIAIPLFLILLLLGAIINWHRDHQFRDITIVPCNQVPGGAEVLEKGLKSGALEQVDSDHVIFSGFYKKVISETEKQRFIQQAALLEKIHKINNSFSEEFCPLLIRFMNRKGTLLPCGTTGGEKCYLTGAAIREYKQLFYREGAATEDEFAADCRKHEDISGLKGKSKQIAHAILKNLVNTGEASTTELGEIDDTLYISNKSGPSNFKRVEISID